MSEFRPSNTYLPGDWNAVCYVCGLRFKASAMRRHWKGYYVCEEDWESRQPQDFVRGVPDNQAAARSQLRVLEFTQLCTPNGITSIVDFAVVDCAIIDYIHPIFDPNLDAFL